MVNVMYVDFLIFYLNKIKLCVDTAALEQHEL